MYSVEVTNQSEALEALSKFIALNTIEYLHIEREINDDQSLKIDVKKVTKEISAFLEGEITGRLGLIELDILDDLGLVEAVEA